MGWIFNRTCSRCGSADGLCVHTNPNLDEDTSDAAAKDAERKLMQYEGWVDSKGRRKGPRR